MKKEEEEGRELKLVKFILEFRDRRREMSKNYKKIIEGLIHEKFKDDPEGLNKRLKEIEEEEKAPKPPKVEEVVTNPITNSQSTELLIEEMNKWAGLNIEMVKILLRQGADIKAKNTEGATILHWSAWRGDLELAKECINAGIYVNVTDVSGETPLHWAVDGDNIALVEFLIKNMADVNISRNDGKTSLDYAKSQKMRELLLNHGAK